MTLTEDAALDVIAFRSLAGEESARRLRTMLQQSPVVESVDVMRAIRSLKGGPPKVPLHPRPTNVKKCNC